MTKQSTCNLLLATFRLTSANFIRQLMATFTLIPPLWTFFHRPL